MKKIESKGRAFVITKEMEDARARLLAYKNKIQSYPEWPTQPREPEAPDVTIKKIFQYIGIDKKALELQRRIVSLEEELNKHLSHTARRKDTY